ncbi:MULTISPECIES: preprotein translocase subunit SecG [Stappiaceae]|jgi:preprotein translocase subunit SecG|uniref:preprotein translocase subunit SecG n=1 Tax=Stappiaceae TaxID=2821832 RepID=UPI000926EA86|nr:preprotein translocase subunit SecG [Labrenzia sp. R4_2]MBO9419063.1 preprotein translocase subunit SecG [Labrenzia sp. R4_2]OJJ11896.1 preprotein translocase subunit SecG [Alphaproteobacteria bacterium AO1-B]
METVVIVIHLMVVLALVLVVLLQRSEGGALGMGGGGGGGGGLMSSRGTANVLTRATAILAVAFFATSLTLSLIASNEDSPASILDAAPAATSGAPAAPGADTDTGAGGGGILDSLRQQSQPSGPQVPAAQ